MKARISAYCSLYWLFCFLLAALGGSFSGVARATWQEFVPLPKIIFYDSWPKMKTFRRQSPASISSSFGILTLR